MDIHVQCVTVVQVFHIQCRGRDAVRISRWAQPGRWKWGKCPWSQHGGWLHGLQGTRSVFLACVLILPPFGNNSCGSAAPALDLPCSSDGKESACSAGDLGLIPGSGRSSGEGNGNPLQYSCLENPMDGGAWRATVHRVEKSGTRLRDFTFTQMEA